MVIRSPFPVPFPQPKPFHEDVMESFCEYGESIALKEDGYEKIMTFNDVLHRSCSLAHSLRDRYGLRKGDVVMTCLENRIEFPILFLGVSALGGITSGANPLYTHGELGKQIVDSGAKFLITSEPLFRKVYKAVESLKGSPQVLSIFVIDASTQTTSTSSRIPIIRFDELCLANSYSSYPEAHIDPKEDAVLLPYSSGTTGLPKGVLLTHYNLQCLLFGRRSMAFLQPLQLEESAILFLPFFHMAGFIGLVAALSSGGMGIIMRQFDIKNYLEAIQRYQVSRIFVVPSVMVFLTKDPSVDKYDLSSVKTVVFGAAPAGKELIESIMKRFLKLESIAQGYGLTESGGLATATPRMPLSQYPFGSCGVPTPYVELKIVSIDGKEEELGPMTNGEIWVRGPNVMKGYYGKPEATRETVDSEGWLHTGDIGYYDFLGHLYVIDRLKELIKYKSYQVAPAELEDQLLKHPAVQEAAVVGIPDRMNPDIGELPTAYVVLKSDFSASEDTASSIQHIVSDHLAPFKHLRGGVVFVGQIPKGGTGKVLRRAVKEMNGKVYGANKHSQRAKL